MAESHNFQDLTGRKFGRLTVIERAENHITKGGASLVQWLCLCDCGNYTIVCACSLRSGNTQSCGCLQKEKASSTHYKHGQSDKRVHRIWNKMKDRCHNPNCCHYKNYGGRGITVCDEWLNDFQAFYDWAIKNSYSDDLTIDRIDNSGNYEPSNCRWVTRREQANNTRRNRFITLNGKTKTASQWCRKFNIRASTFYTRIERGWDIEKALTKQVQKRHSRANK